MELRYHHTKQLQRQIAFYFLLKIQNDADKKCSLISRTSMEVTIQTKTLVMVVQDSGGKAYGSTQTQSPSQSILLSSLFILKLFPVYKPHKICC